MIDWKQKKGKRKKENFFKCWWMGQEAKEEKF